MMKRILTIVGLLFLSLSTALATTYYFTDGGFDPANPSRRAPLAAKGDACGVSDGVGGYTGCRFILPDLKEETVAPSSSGLPINFHGYKMTTSVDFGPNEMVPVGCTDHNTCVSEYPSDDDTTYLKGTSDDEKEVYELELGDVPEGLTEPILGVTITVSSKGTAVGDTSYKFGVEQIDAATGNTVDNYGTQVTQSSTTFAQAYTTFLTNPLTGLAWTMNDVSAMKGVFTYTHVPLPGLPNPRFSAINVFVSTATAPLLSYPGTPPAGGTIDNPWCLDPASVGIRNSFEFLMDGTGTELASGDTVMLCAGNCDGTGSATYYIEPHATAHQTRGDGSVLYVAFDPKVGTTTPATTIVNIQAYPGENVTVSGDSNHDFHYTHGVDADRFWDSYESTGSTTHAGYAFSGFTVERFADRVVNTAQVDGGSTVFSDMTFQHNGAGGSAGIGDGAFVNIDGGTFQMGCTNTNAKRDGINGSVDDYAVFIFGGNKNGASLSVTYSTIRYNCELTSRTNGNCYDGSSFNSATAVELCDPATSAAGLTFDHDTIYGVFGLQNGHQGRGWTWTNNLIYDFFEGITMEENTQANVITDNSISCRGVYQTDAAGRCRTAIKVDDGDQGEQNCDDTGSTTCGKDHNLVCPHCSSRNNVIARNRIWGVNSYPSPGYLLGGIAYFGHNASAYDAGASLSSIDNNMIWFTGSSNGCAFSSEASAIEAPLMIASSDPITVRNNTVWNNQCSALLATGFTAYSGGTGAVAHTFTNNLVGFAHDYHSGGNSDTSEFFVTPDASGSTITNNLLHYGSDSASGGVACILGTGGEGASGGCTSGSYRSCATWPGFQTENICAPPQFKVCNTAAFCTTVDTDKNHWDLRLAGTQSAINNGIAGPTSDIDGFFRPNPNGPLSCIADCTDIGASEWCPLGVGEVQPDPLPVKR